MFCVNVPILSPVWSGLFKTASLSLYRGVEGGLAGEDRAVSAKMLFSGVT